MIRLCLDLATAAGLHERALQIRLQTAQAQPGLFRTYGPVLAGAMCFRRPDRAALVADRAALATRQSYRVTARVTR